VAQQPYVEHLRVPWWLWLPALGVAALLAAEVYLGAPGLAPGCRTRSSSRRPPSACGGWAGSGWPWKTANCASTTPGCRFRFVAGVTVLGVAERRVLLGVGARPHAFVVQRPWVRGAVQVHLDDPADPTPYWVVSSRRPRRWPRRC
jgi:hypothetical protein